MPAYTYILASKRNGTLYTGVTNNLANRIEAHKAGYVDSFTKQYDVKLLVHAEEYENMQDARARERQIKNWRRAWKISLIEENNPQWKDLSVSLF